jgi:hypothetical protein
MASMDTDALKKLISYRKPEEFIIIDVRSYFDYNRGGTCWLARETPLTANDIRQLLHPIDPSCLQVVLMDEEGAMDGTAQRLAKELSETTNYVVGGFRKLAREYPDILRMRLPQTSEKGNIAELQEIEKLYVKISCNELQAKKAGLPSLIIPGVYLGSEKSSDPETLDRLSIDVVVRLRTSIEAVTDPRPERIYHLIRLEDSANGNIQEACDICIRAVQNAIEERKNVLVHCQAGISRSASVMIAFIMQHFQVSVMKAWWTVLRQRPIISPNVAFSKYLASIGNDDRASFWIRNPKLYQRNLKIQAQLQQ